MDSNTRPHKFKSILLSILHFFNFGIAYTCVVFMLILVLTIIFSIPVIGELFYRLLNLLFKLRGDGLGPVTIYLGLTAAYYASKGLVERITEHEPTLSRTFFLSGIYITTINALLLLDNIINRGNSIQSWMVSVGFIIAGFVIICNRKRGHSAATSSKSNSLDTNEHHTEEGCNSSVTTHAEETVYYMEAANGMTVRVPESKLDSWVEEQERIKNMPETGELTEREKMLRDRILHDIYGPKSDSK